MEKYEEALFRDSRWMSSQFYELEKFLFNLLDGTTESGLERVKLKLETPLTIADRLLSSCQALAKQEYENASEDLISITGILSSIKDYSAKIESESVTWRKSITSAVCMVIDNITSVLIGDHTNNSLISVPEFSSNFKIISNLFWIFTGSFFS